MRVLPGGRGIPGGRVATVREVLRPLRGREVPQGPLRAGRLPGRRGSARLFGNDRGGAAPPRHMTALKQFARLEAPGIWRAEPEAQRRDVVVAFGDATLVISDQAGRALSHWSLAAVARINPGDLPALYTPSADALEVLEIEDDSMV